MAESIMFETLADAGETRPITRVQLVEKETGQKKDVDVFTCARGVICDEGKPVQEHVNRLYEHIDDTDVHLTAEEKKGLETTAGAQEKADAALAAAKEYAVSLSPGILQAAGEDAQDKADAALDAAKEFAATNTNQAMQEAALQFQSTAAQVAQGLVTEHNNDAAAHPYLVSLVTGGVQSRALRAYN